MNWESRIDIYTLPCVKQLASGKLLYNTESSALCSDHLDGWGGRGWERGSRGRIYMYSYGRFTLLYSRKYHTEKQLCFNLKFFKISLKTFSRYFRIHETIYFIGNHLFYWQKPSQASMYRNSKCSVSSFLKCYFLHVELFLLLKYIVERKEKKLHSRPQLLSPPRTYTPEMNLALYQSLFS